MKEVTKVIGFRPLLINCCVNHCLAYTGRFRNATKCINCRASRYQDYALNIEEDNAVELAIDEDSDDENNATYGSTFGPLQGCKVSQNSGCKF